MSRKPMPMPGSFLAPQQTFPTTEDAQASYGFAAPPLAGAAGEGEAEPVTRGRLAEIRQWVALPVIAIEGNPYFARLALIDLLAHVDKTEATAQAAFDCLKTASSDLESARARLAEETRAAAEAEREKLHMVKALKLAKKALATCYNVTDYPGDGASPQDAALRAVAKALSAAGPLLGDEGKEVAGE